ncbi:MAG: hypothetical protein HDT42_09050 [Ruminococcaceae bacterium]|nr:hypothetical protein [Oscillospiraceae bacterium]
MDRLTVNSEILDGHHELKCLCNDVVPEYKGNCCDYCELNADCEYCGIRQAFDRLAAYEDTGLTPAEVVILKAKMEDSYTEHLDMLCDTKDNQASVLFIENQRLKKLIKEIEDILRKGEE